MKKLFSALFLGSAITAFASAGAFAQQAQTTTQNPFGQGAQVPAPASPALRKTRAPAGLKAGQFASESGARATCPGDTVVWVNTGTKVYHHAGTASYGTTKKGAYMCEKDTAAAGFRAAKNEKRK